MAVIKDQNWNNREDQEWIDRSAQVWEARYGAVQRPDYPLPVVEEIRTEADASENSKFLEGKPRESADLQEICNRINQIIQDELIDPTLDIEQQASILDATGIWLDYIGARLKFPRPMIAEDQSTLWFGFDGHGLGFDQANFVPDNPEKIGIADDPYRDLLIVRGGQLLTDCSIPSMDAIIKAAFGTGGYIDHGDMSLTIILDDTQPDIIIEAILEPFLTYFRSISVDNVFGFDGNGVGFDQAIFVPDAFIGDTGLLTKPAGVRFRDILISHREGTFGFDGNGVGFDQGPFVRTIDDFI